jgi:integrase
MDTSSVLQMTHESEVPQSSKLTVMPKPEVTPKAKTRTRGTGSLLERGRMYWMEFHYNGERIRQTLNVPVTGKKADKEEAIRRLEEQVRAIRAGEQPKKFAPITVQAMYDAWMLAVETNCKPGTIKDYKIRWSHLEPVFGKVMATQVTLDKTTEYLHRRKQDGAGVCTLNRENRVLQMIFGHNKSKIPADHFPEFPKMHSEKAHVRKGRLSKTDYETLRTRLEDPKLFWLKVILTMTWKYGFRKAELQNAKVKYFDHETSTFGLPAFTTKNDMPRVVRLVRDGEIFQMLTKLTAGRDGDAPLFMRNGKPVRDYRGEWAKQTAGMSGGSGKGGSITIHDLRRSALSGMDAKGITAKQAGTHLTADVFARYIVPTDQEQEANAAKIEGD